MVPLFVADMTKPPPSISWAGDVRPSLRRGNRAAAQVRPGDGGMDGRSSFGLASGCCACSGFRSKMLCKFALRGLRFSRKDEQSCIGFIGEIADCLPSDSTSCSNSRLSSKLVLPSIQRCSKNSFCGHRYGTPPSIVLPVRAFRGPPNACAACRGMFPRCAHTAGGRIGAHP